MSLIFGFRIRIVWIIIIGIGPIIELDEESIFGPSEPTVSFTDESFIIFSYVYYSFISMLFSSPLAPFSFSHSFSFIFHSVKFSRSPLHSPYLLLLLLQVVTASSSFEPSPSLSPPSPLSPPLSLMWHCCLILSVTSSPCHTSPSLPLWHVVSSSCQNLFIRRQLWSEWVGIRVSFRSCIHHMWLVLQKPIIFYSLTPVRLAFWFFGWIKLALIHHVSFMWLYTSWSH